MIPGAQPFIPRTEGGLRRGFTTGSCAAAASKAAAQLLFEDLCAEKVSLLTPKGICLEMEIESREKKEGRASCSVKKYAGDDPDITDGIRICSTVSLDAGKSLPGALCADKLLPDALCDGKLSLGASCAGDVFAASAHHDHNCYVEKTGDGLTLYLRGGEGIGRVTRAGLSCPVGMWAINPVPRRMIFAEVARVAGKAGFKGSVWITLEIPGGREIARKTFNPRLGIEGGLSVLGSSGIVEPMSEPALLETIRLEIGQKALEKEECLLMVPGNYGERFLEEKLLLPVEKAVKCSNYIGKALDMAVDAGIEKILLVGHAGKLIKLAAGVMNTHSKAADGRMECLAAYGAACGASREMARQILDCVTVDEALGVLEQKEGLREETMVLAMQRISAVLRKRTELRQGMEVSQGIEVGQGMEIRHGMELRQGIEVRQGMEVKQKAEGRVRVEVILFTDERGILGMTDGAEELVGMVSENDKKD